MIIFTETHMVPYPGVSVKGCKYLDSDISDDSCLI